MAADPFDVSKLKPGQAVIVGGHLWGRCEDCLKIRRMDKFLFGQLHFCVPPEERKP